MVIELETPILNVVVVDPAYFKINLKKVKNEN